MSGTTSSLPQQYYYDNNKKDQRKRGYVLLLSSLIYFSAVVLDHFLLIPPWKYNNNNGNKQKQKQRDDDSFVPPTTQQLKVTTLPRPSSSHKKDDDDEQQECKNLLHKDYINSHEVVMVNKTPKPYTKIFAPPKKYSIITRELIQNGYWELPLYKKIKQKFQKEKKKPGRTSTSMTLLDVGANMGLFTIYAQSLGANVIAVEAMESNSDFIVASECLNSNYHHHHHLEEFPAGSNRGTIQLYNYAIHPSPGGVNCNVKGGGNNVDDGHMRCTEKKVPKENNEDNTKKTNDNQQKSSSSSQNNEDEQQQPLARLDEIVQHDQIIDMMKIDVEGFEQAVMESSNKLDYPPLGIVFECDARLAKTKDHNTLFWRRYMNDNPLRCNGFTYTTDLIDSTYPIQLTFPYMPFIDAIALGTCGGGNFYLDCSGFGGEGIIMLLYRWIVHLFFAITFVFGVRVFVVKIEDNDLNLDLDGTTTTTKSTTTVKWNPLVFKEIMKQTRFLILYTIIIISLILC